MMSDEGTKILARLFTIAEMYGTAFGKMTFDPEKEEFVFSIIPNDQVIVKYDLVQCNRCGNNYNQDRNHFGYPESHTCLPNPLGIADEQK